MVDDVKVDFPKGHTNIIKLSDDITVEMRYPDLDYFATVNFALKKVDPYDLIAKCIKRVYVGEDDSGKFTYEEAREWVETLTNSQFQEIQKFFNTMPSLKHELKVKNPKTKVENKIVLQGLAAFFV